MAFTKNQILTFLQNKKDQAGKPDAPANSSSKYLLYGLMHLLVQNDLISLAQIQAEFPELA